jgi:hypothetical protein
LRTKDSEMSGLSCRRMTLRRSNVGEGFRKNGGTFYPKLRLINSPNLKRSIQVTIPDPSPRRSCRRYSRIGTSTEKFPRPEKIRHSFSKRWQQGCPSRRLGWNVAAGQGCGLRRIS